MITETRKQELIKWASRYTRREVIEKLMRKHGAVTTAMFKGRKHCEKKYPGRVNWGRRPAPYDGPRNDEETSFIDSISLRLKDKRIDELNPMAARGKKQIAQCKQNASKGGRATAHYTDKQIEQAFKEFKQRNPSKSAWDAACALIRKNQSLSKFKRVTGPWNRIERIALYTQGITRQEWFDTL